MLEIVGMPS